MKVYVDKLPKSCLECPCCSLSKSQAKYVKEWDFICCNPLRQNMRWKPNERLKLKDCPLQSIADYTKQVRKDFVQEIKSKIVYYAVSLLDEAGNVKENVWGISKKILIRF